MSRAPKGITKVFRANTNTGFVISRVFQDETDFSLYVRTSWPGVAITSRKWTPPPVVKEGYRHAEGRRTRW